MAIKCEGCGSASHDVSVCQTKRVLEQAREIAELKRKLEVADRRAAELESHFASCGECHECAVESGLVVAEPTS